MIFTVDDLFSANMTQTENLSFELIRILVKCSTLKRNPAQSLKIIENEIKGEEKMAYIRRITVNSFTP